MEKRGEIELIRESNKTILEKSKLPRPVRKYLLKKEDAEIQKLKHNALKISIKEGSALSVSGLGSTYITPFALALNAKSIHIGILSSLSGLLSPLAQFFGSRLMEKNSRKNIVMKFVLAEALMWLPIALLAFLFWQNILPGYAPFILIGLYSLLVIFSGFSYPAWFSWMGDLVPEDERGKYFCTRNKTTGIVGLVATLIGAYLLKVFESKGYVLIGFAVLFILSFGFRMTSFRYLHKQYEPRFKLKKGSYFSIWSFLKRMDNYGKFAVYQTFFNFALMIASPFFSVYMLKSLGFNYVTYIIVSLSSSVFYLLFLPLAGKFSDKYGNVKLFFIANILFVIGPILWLFIKSPVLLIALPQVTSGMANAALVISVTNFTYSAVSQQHRGICVAYTNIIIGIGVFFGSLLGGLLISYINFSFITPFFFVFIVSALLRLAVALIFMPKIQEVKPVKHIPPMHIKLAHPFKTLHAEIGWVKHFLK